MASSVQSQLREWLSAQARLAGNYSFKVKAVQEALTLLNHAAEQPHSQIANQASTYRFFCAQKRNRPTPSDHYRYWLWDTLNRML